MDGFHYDVQELLRDIDSNDGQAQVDQSSLPYSNSVFNAPPPHVDPAKYSEQQLDSLHTQHEQYPVQDSRIEDTAHHSAQQNGGLDAFDQALLAEAPPQLPWPSTNRGTGLSGGRLSLPGHTAPCSLSLDSFEKRKMPARQRVVPAEQHFKSQLAHYIHSPHAQRHASSSSDAPPSSPSCRVKKRQDTHASWSSAPSLTTNYLPSHNFQDRPQKRPPVSSDKTALQERPSFASSPPLQPRIQPQIDLPHAPPTVQGVQLVSVNELPDRLRSVFRHPLFNAIQSKCFRTAYKSDDNLVVSAPTGGGKTAILELAICRLVSGYKTDQYKIVYMAPTKSLCSERYRDWQAKFATLDLHCAELTGDTEHGQLRNVQSASIIITTPEKWDSMTRKWKDHVKLMQMVKLFLIDEVHILKDSRGSTLEAVVSRMKSVGSSVRFVALSATVPNSEDIATWLGKDPANQHLPAFRERFSEDFRPVRLQKHVIGLPYKGSDFGFESFCDPKLPDIIFKFSHKKPIMVFCITRKATVNTAKLLANTWASKGPRDRHWEGPTQRIVVQDPELKKTITSGVAFHHAGLENYDRHAVEKGFLEGQINVICCTSTLAVGVNLPCHMVIIKNTVSWSEEGLKEYSDLEVMQMLGRAGRPQFDTTAVAVIITKQEKLSNYEKLVSGEELLESCLHLNLIDHLNAEIGLGTVHDVYTAKRWLAGTFLYVRLGQNPSHYKLDGDAVDQDLNDRIERICKRDLALLEDTQLISSSDGRLRATEFGDAMARYYVEFKTMQVLLRLQRQAKMSDILSAVVQAQEYHEIRLKAGEKKLFKKFNQAGGMKFPIKVDIAIPAHKRSLILQAELGGVEFPPEEQFAKFKRQFNQEKTILFSHIHRLIRCVIDCQIALQDGVAVRHALELARSFSARVWDNSPYQLKQIAQVGSVAVRKLAIGGINSLEALEAAEPHRIEMLMSKNPPFGHRLLGQLKEFPKLLVSVKLMNKEIIKGRPVVIKVKAECGFMNEKVPTTFHRKPVYICVLTERSDGHLIDFRRISATHLSNGKDILISAELFNQMQYLTCYVMCEAVAGTLRYAELRPDLPAHLFPSSSAASHDQKSAQNQRGIRQSRSDLDDRNLHNNTTLDDEDEFAEEAIDDQDMVDAAVGIDFSHIDQYASNSAGCRTISNSTMPKTASVDHNTWKPERLDNGKWACNHSCKDKTACKHLCCREGVDKAPKAPRKALAPASDKSINPSIRKEMGKPSTIAEKLLTSKKFKKGTILDIETVDLANDKLGTSNESRKPKGLKNLNRLHGKVVKSPATLVTASKKSSSTSRSSFPCDDTHAGDSSAKRSTDYSDDWTADLPSPSAMLNGNRQHRQQPSETWPTNERGHDLPPANASDLDYLEDFDIGLSNDDQETQDLEAAMVGLEDSITLNKSHLEVHSPHFDARNGKVPSRELQKPLERKAKARLQSKLKGCGDEEVTQMTSAEGQRGYGMKRKIVNDEWEGASENEGDRKQMERVGRVPLMKNSARSDASSTLFLSTDSPEKQPDQYKEANTATNMDDEALSVPATVSKRRRLTKNVDDSVELLPAEEANSSNPAPTIRSGQPAWVYEFDPEFIAEWQDFVDFV